MAKSCWASGKLLQVEKSPRNRVTHACLFYFCSVVVEPARGTARGSNRDRYDDRYSGRRGGGGGRYNDK